MPHQLTPIFEGRVEAGKLSLCKKAQFMSYLGYLEGKPVQVTVAKKVRRRSGNQNAYYWGVVLALIAEHTGADPDEVHTALKYQFSPKRFVGNLVAPATTRRMDTAEFGTYLEKVRRWAAEELNIHIPDPEDVHV